MRPVSLTVLLTAALLSGCSKGSLYLTGEDSDWTSGKTETSISVYDGESPSVGMPGVYGREYELFFGSSGNYYELLYLIRREGESQEKIERFLFRQEEPLDIRAIALQPQSAFNPMKDADCFIKVTGTMTGQDTCEGAATCKLFQNPAIYSETESDTCSWPGMNSFILKVDAGGDSGQVPEPGSENWTTLQRINLPRVSAKIIEISDSDEKFTSVAGTLNDNELRVAGKKKNTNLFSAVVFGLAADAEPKHLPLEDSVGLPFSERASTDKDLLALTPDGFYLLQPSGTWTVLALPEGMAAMPDKAKVIRVESANGQEVAAFRIVTKDAGIETQQLIAYKGSEAKLVLLPTENPVTPEPVGGYAIHIVNNQVWLWNSDAPGLAYRYLFAENQWNAFAPVIPAADDPGISSRYLLTPAGESFVLSTYYDKKFRLTSFDDGTEIRRRVYRHYYYNERGEYTERFINTIAPPEALRFHGAKMYAERVVGIGPSGQDMVMDYGYVYDFASRRGYLFKDTLGPDLNAPDWLSWYGSVAVSGSKVAFIGGCDKPTNRLCLPVSHVNRVIDLNPPATSF